MLPIKQVLFTFAPAVPIQITLVPVVTPEPAEISRAVLESPVVFLEAPITDGGVPAGGVAKEGISAVGGVEAAGRVSPSAARPVAVLEPR